jgi:hypothetical protein
MRSMSVSTALITSARLCGCDRNRIDARSMVKRRRCNNDSARLRRAREGRATDRHVFGLLRRGGLTDNARQQQHLCGTPRCPRHLAARSET